MGAFVTGAPPKKGVKKVKLLAALLDTTAAAEAAAAAVAVLPPEDLTLAQLRARIAAANAAGSGLPIALPKKSVNKAGLLAAIRDAAAAEEAAVAAAAAEEAAVAAAAAAEAEAVAEAARVQKLTAAQLWSALETLRAEAPASVGPHISQSQATVKYYPSQMADVAVARHVTS